MKKEERKNQPRMIHVHKVAFLMEKVAKYSNYLYFLSIEEWNKYIDRWDSVI